MARCSASAVVASRRVASGPTSPTGTVRAASPKKPWYDTPKSSPTTSPSLSTRRSDGMPCTTSSLIEMQMVAG